MEEDNKYLGLNVIPKNNKIKSPPGGMCLQYDTDLIFEMYGKYPDDEREAFEMLLWKALNE